jgi:eukaryotic-like serine/threonine-protein kinase
MENLANAIRQFQSGALGRAEFFAQLDRMLAASPQGAGALLEALNQAHARAPLPAEVYAEVEQRIARALEARQHQGAEETYVQTRPQGGAASQPGAAPDRMKGVGDTLNGRFVLEECIGFGGMGTVYKALDLRKLEASDRKPYIAIKVLNVQFQGHPKSLIALQREARKAQSLAHPNIVSVYDFDRDGSMVYLTMEYLTGKPLSQVLRAPGFRGMPYPEAMRIVTGMGKALAYAHERGFVHCDFKPANVILTDSGVVKVIDFGIARVFQKAEEDADVTVFDPGSLGALTPAYASPEMLENREPDPRDDIYALGCISYELLTGRHPFNRMSATQARDGGVRVQRPPGLGHRPWRAIKCALAFERNARTPTVNRFLDEIGGQPMLGRPRMLVAAGGAVLGLAGLAAILFFRSGPPAAPGTAKENPAPTPITREPPPAPIVAETPPAAPIVSEKPVQSAPPPPAPVPALTLASVTAALSGVPCAALAPSVRGHAMRVEGFLPRSYGQARLGKLLAAIPGASSVDLALQEIDDKQCPLLSALGPYWTAHRMAGGGGTLRLNRPGGGTGLAQGDPLMVEVTAPTYQSYVAVDYFQLDGNVVHLLPNLRARDNLRPAGQRSILGGQGEWLIGPPFGNEMLVLVASPVPLFDGLRPETEPAAAYLKALQKEMARIGRAQGPARLAVDLVQISTRPR